MAYFNNNNNLHQNTQKTMWCIPLPEEIMEMLHKNKVYPVPTCAFQGNYTKRIDITA
jgi:hypothetical protein